MKHFLKTVQIKVENFIDWLLVGLKKAIQSLIMDGETVEAQCEVAHRSPLQQQSLMQLTCATAF